MKNYRRSLLVQGRMEIAYLVTVKMPTTLRNTKLTEKYIELVKENIQNQKPKRWLAVLLQIFVLVWFRKFSEKNRERTLYFLKNNPCKWILERCSRPTNALKRIKTFLKLLKSNWNFYRRLCYFFILLL